MLRERITGATRRNSRYFLGGKQMLPLILLLVAVATAAAPVSAPTPETQRALGTLSSLGAAVDGPDLQPRGPVTAASVAHARVYIEHLDFPTAVAAAVELRRTQVLARADMIGSQLPVSAKAALARDMAAALDAAGTHYIDDQLAFASIWFAQRLTWEELQEGIDFLSQELGAKMSRNAAGLTPAEREAIGRYTMEHPAMIRLTAADLQFARAALARRAMTSAAFDAELTRTLCPRLVVDRIQLPSCTAHAGPREPSQ